MGYISDLIQGLGPAGIVVKAILAALIGDALILAFILLRRAYRKRHFAKRDARVLHFRRFWSKLLSVEIPHHYWRGKAFDRGIVTSLALDAIETAPPEEAAQLLKFLRSQALLENLVHEAETHSGWRRRRALVALGRTRAPEAIPALAEGLRDKHPETRLAALRGLGRTGLPSAAEEILKWVGEAGLAVPALPLENALINCCRERPGLLLPFIAGASGPLREVLARVLAEVATSALETDIIEMAWDSSPELRASAARALARAKPKTAVPILTEMVKDPAWVVRLRAAVALGQIRTPLVVPPLVSVLTDPHRLVRLRAAQVLVEHDENPVATFERVVETGDAYAQDAYITAAENAGTYEALCEAIKQDRTMDAARRESLLAAASFRLNSGEERKSSVPQPDVVSS
jgi:HEAT repeat protein